MTRKQPVQAATLSRSPRGRWRHRTVHPSLAYREFGVAVAEALAMGTPVLISDKVNIWREIEADGAGLVAPDTRAGTAGLLQGWLDLAPDARQQMTERARVCFAQRFEMHKAVENLLGVIRATRDTNRAGTAMGPAEEPTA